TIQSQRRVDRVDIGRCVAESRDECGDVRRLRVLFSRGQRALDKGRMKQIVAVEGKDPRAAGFAQSSIAGCARALMRLPDDPMPVLLSLLDGPQQAWRRAAVVGEDDFADGMCLRPHALQGVGEKVMIAPDRNDDRDGLLHVILAMSAARALRAAARLALLN